MFTGIIKDVGVVAGIAKRGEGLRLSVKTNNDEFKDLKIDESVSISGACQTVVVVRGNIFEVDTIEETLKKTTLGSYQVGTKVNLERALKASDRLGGHFVQGHVDGVGKIISVEKQSRSWLYRVEFKKEFDPLIVPIGSIAIDGVSLTVSEVQGNIFTVAIIPYTFENTTLWQKNAGDEVNLEFDILGKFIVKQLGSLAIIKEPAITEARLKELGY